MVDLCSATLRVTFGSLPGQLGMLRASKTELADEYARTFGPLSLLRAQRPYAGNPVRAQLAVTMRDEGCTNMLVGLTIDHAKAVQSRISVEHEEQVIQDSQLYCRLTSVQRAKLP